MSPKEYDGLVEHYSSDEPPEEYVNRNKITQFKMLSSNGSCTLSLKVQDALDEGWELWGKGYGTQMCMHQPMIKRGNENE